MKTMTDRQLLGAFLADNDESAFAKIVERHGAMVCRVAFRVLKNQADSEDVMQAVFITLAKKASTLRKTESLPGWLYHVSYRTALDWKKSSQRRIRREREAEAMKQKSLSDARDTEAGLAAIYETLDTMKEHYRTAVILHHLQGYSQAEAAGILGVTESCFFSRLSRARDILKKKLSRKAIALPAALLLFKAEEAACATLLPAAITKTVVASSMTAVSSASAAAAGATAAGGGAGATGAVSATGTAATSAKIVKIASAAEKLLFWSKIKSAACIALASATVATGGGVAYSELKPEPQKVEATAIAEIPPAPIAEQPVEQKEKQPTGMVPPRVPLGETIHIVRSADRDMVTDLDKHFNWEPDETAELMNYFQTIRGREIGLKDLRAIAGFGVDIIKYGESYFTLRLAMVPVDEKYFESMHDWMLPDKRYIDAIEMAYGGEFTPLVLSTERFKPTFLFKTADGNCGIMQFTKSEGLDLAFSYRFLKTGVPNVYTPAFTKNEHAEAVNCYNLWYGDGKHEGDMTMTTIGDDHACCYFSMVPFESGKKEENSRFRHTWSVSELLASSAKGETTIESDDCRWDSKSIVFSARDKLDINQLLKKLRYHLLDIGYDFKAKTLIFYDACVMPVNFSKKNYDSCKGILRKAKPATVSFISHEACRKFPADEGFPLPEKFELQATFLYKNRIGKMGLLILARLTDSGRDVIVFTQDNDSGNDGDAGAGMVAPRVPLRKDFEYTMPSEPEATFCDLERHQSWNLTEATELQNFMAQQAAQDRNNIATIRSASKRFGMDIIRSDSSRGHYLLGLVLIPVDEKYFDTMHDWSFPEKRYIDAVESAYGGDFATFQTSTKRFKPTYLFKTVSGNCGIIQFTESQWRKLSFKYRFLKTGVKNEYVEPLNKAEIQAAQKYFCAPGTVACHETTNVFMAYTKIGHTPFSFSLVVESRDVRNSDPWPFQSRYFFRDFLIEGYPLAEREPIYPTHNQTAWGRRAPDKKNNVIYSEAIESMFDEPLEKSYMRKIRNSMEPYCPPVMPADGDTSLKFITAPKRSFDRESSVPMTILPAASEMTFDEMLGELRQNHVDGMQLINKPTGAFVFYDVAIAPLFIEFEGVDKIPDDDTNEEWFKYLTQEIAQFAPGIFDDILNSAKAPTVSYIFPDAYPDFPYPVFAYKTRTGIKGLFTIKKNPNVYGKFYITFYVFGKPEVKDLPGDTDVF